MGCDRLIVRSMAVMVLAIIAFVAPFAVEAHEGHVHCAGHKRAVSVVSTASASEENLAPAASSRIPEMPVKLLATPRLQAATGRPTASLRAAGADRGCCPGACKRGCCGAMVCGTVGIVAGAASLVAPVFRAAVLIPHDLPGRAGIGPEALRKPPRTLA
ncbi:MAG: hypothetical protein EKK44_03880 [Methylobacterium sp.]|nr:MAG: hypothetical protein EKK44_03880 [Methylobacterium sp.]